ncbi:hypothetical protein MKW94_026647 [Papaver nudicaule]|uniref:DYW domain-containing protein n=1 Tax=Papaver nudicaule TaxID=74823 RepID=A0AA41VQG8_PAPNU|nr:hypothetical protein [Papaver nudicaule]
MALVAAPPSPPSHHLLHATSTTARYPIHHHHKHLLNLLENCNSMTQLKQIHAQALRTTTPNHPDTLYLYSRIMHFAAFSDLHYSSRLLPQIHKPNSFIWNTLIRAYAWSSHHKDHSISVYQRMLIEGSVAPDKHTFPFILKACAFVSALSEGKQIHGHILKLGFGSDKYVSNSLIHFYVSCGCLDLSVKVFEEMPDRNLVSWNAMIDGFVQSGEFAAALRMFVEMQDLFEPDGFTMQSLVSACGGLGALSLGMWVHAYMVRNCDFVVKNDVLMNNSLVDMYCKCGSVEMARQVFDGMDKRDVNSWNSMILGFAMHGEVKDALEAFDVMCDMGNIMPNSITFIGVLSACNHGGMVCDGKKYFELMVDVYKIEPRLEHYGCMVDLLARNGLVNEALDLVSSMPIKPDVVIWRSLLDACCKRNVDIELTESVAKQVIESEDEGVSSGVYVLLSKVYASANRWEEVGLVRRLMSEKGIIKEPGCSSMELEGEFHRFLSGDTSHPHTKVIYQALDAIEQRLQDVGYVPDLSQASMIDELDDRKQNSLCLHSERLAIAFGLLKSRPGIPIRIFKNLRVCNDCHTVTKLISRLFDVDIIVRDRVRFHHFKDGFCSCKDYW